MDSQTRNSGEGRGLPATADRLSGRLRLALALGQAAGRDLARLARVSLPGLPVGISPRPAWLRPELVWGESGPQGSGQGKPSKSSELIEISEVPEIGGLLAYSPTAYAGYSPTAYAGSTHTGGGHR